MPASSKQPARAQLGKHTLPPSVPATPPQLSLEMIAALEDTWTAVRGLTQGAPSYAMHIFLTHRNREMMNEGCFWLLSLRVICYTAAV